VEQRDDKAFDVLTDKTAHGLLHASPVERCVDRAIGAEPLAHFEHPGAGHQRRRARSVQVERVRKAQAL
jgi:hypothetical protein